MTPPDRLAVIPLPGKVTLRFESPELNSSKVSVDTPVRLLKKLFRAASESGVGMGGPPDGLRSSPKNVTGAACVLPAPHPRRAATAVAAKNRFLMLIGFPLVAKLARFKICRFRGQHPLIGSRSVTFVKSLRPRRASFSRSTLRFQAFDERLGTLRPMCMSATGGERADR